VRGVLPLDWDRRQRITPVEPASQEAWPEAEPWGLASLWQEPWWNAGRRTRPLPTSPASGGGEREKGASRDRKVAEDTDQRLSAFRFLFSFLSSLPIRQLRRARSFHCPDDVRNSFAASPRAGGHASDAHRIARTGKRVIASAGEAIQRSMPAALDCFVARVPRNDTLVRSFPRKRESRLGPRFRGDERAWQSSAAPLH